MVFATPERARYVSSLFKAMNAKTWGKWVPGFCDGDWPPWLQKEMGEVLPGSVLRKYAKKVASCINGYYWEIEERDLPAILKALEALGIRAVKAPGLRFY